MADIEIEIDGKKLTAKPDQMVIQVADEAGIYIPRFCYHKHLSVAANCRMCLVEVEKAPKALPACATPVMQGMKVFTKSKKAIAAQRAVMEFLLINHPLDCPICDQGGECELQDLSMGFGASNSSYNECKRAVPDLELGPLISTEMTRCIHCTRCVRFGTEIAGMREMGSTYRGEHTEISTFVKHAIESEVSGNIIDLCPVGALTSKPYRFTARAWEMRQSPAVSPHDCLGSNLNVHTLNGVVKRVVARENNAINLSWLADRDRFGYTGLYHADRLMKPMVRSHGKLVETDWERAFEAATEGLQKVLNAHGVDAFGALTSPNATLEEHYLLQKIVRAIGSPHIDHRLRETDTSDQAAMPLQPGMEMPIADLQQVDRVLLVGSNLQKEQPIAAVHLRTAIKRGAVVCAINPIDYAFNFETAVKGIVSPAFMPALLAAVVTKLGGKVDSGVEIDASAQAAAEKIANELKSGERKVIILGALAMHHAEAATLRALARQLAKLANAKVAYMTDGANSAGAWLAGAVPHRDTAGVAVAQTGLSTHAMLAQPRKAYLLMNVEPAKDLADARQAQLALKQADFVLALSMYHDAALEDHADVVLPMSAFTETAGTYVNAAGEWQAVKGAAKPVGESRPAWKILRVLGNFLHLDGFGYESAEEVRNEIKARIDAAPAFSNGEDKPVSIQAGNSKSLSRIGEVPIYALDSLVRHAQPLQEAQRIMDGHDSAIIKLHPETASHHGLQAGDIACVSQGEAEAILPVQLDMSVPVNAAWVAGGIPATGQLGNLFGDMTIKKVNHAR